MARVAIKPIGGTEKKKSLPRLASGGKQQVSKKPSGGMGYTITATNRATGKKTTSSGVTKRVTAAEFNSNKVSMKKTAKPRTTASNMVQSSAKYRNTTPGAAGMISGNKKKVY